MRWIWANVDAADPAAVAATSRTAPLGRVRFQNRAIAVEDLLAMFAVESAICHLNFLVAVPDPPGPAPDVSELVVATLDGGLGGQRPASWDDLAHVRKRGGCQPLDAADLAERGTHASQYPAFG